MDEQTESTNESPELATLRARFEESFRNLQELQREIEEEKSRIESKR
jgi:hypothetical protein